MCSAPGGAVAGAANNRCTADGGASIKQATNQAACHPADAGTTDAASTADASAAGPDYGDTLFNSEGDDDDCKYHVKWTSTPVCEGTDVTFTVTATRREDGKPLTGAKPRAEVYLNDAHPAPNTHQVPGEESAGTYTVGPIRFDAPGRWTVRFHFYEDCADTLSESPHGHAAFFVQVP